MSLGKQIKKYRQHLDWKGFIKRLQRVPGEGYRVLSDNPKYETWTIKQGMDFEIFGKVIKVWKSEDF